MGFAIFRWCLEKLLRMGKPPSDRDVRGEDAAMALSDAADLAELHLAEERTRKTSLESRSTTVISTTATLATFLFGLAAFSKSLGGHLTPADDVAVGSALFLFLVGTVSAVLAIYVRHYSEANVDELGELIDEANERRLSSRDVGLYRARLAITLLESSRAVNKYKARLFQVAIGSLAVGVALLLLTVLLVSSGQ
jgi:hypothetical protein